jgi:hypothetical protein
VAGTANNAFDSWSITGAATLSGILSVDAIAGFTPSAGQSFTILTAASVDAASLTLGGPDASLFSLVKTSNSLVLQSATAGVAGDYNHNGVVDSADYVVWRNQNNTNVTAGTGADGDGNGVVNSNDYDFWRARFGKTASASGLSESAGVPEPTTAIMAALLLIGLSFVRSSRM